MTDIPTSGETYRIAHSAQCKLHLSASRPDRNLRFLLGHAFTLDKLMLRIVEIEDEEKQRKSEAPLADQPRRVSFQDNSIRPSSDFNCAAAGPAAAPKTTGRKGGRAPSPPPSQSLEPHDSDTSSDDYDDDDEEDDGLGLSLTTSHIAMPPPHLVADDDPDEDVDDEGPISPSWTPTEGQLETIVEEDGDEELAGIYETIRGCGCMQHEKAPAIEQIWEVPGDKTGLEDGRRRAVIAVRA